MLQTKVWTKPYLVLAGTRLDIVILKQLYVSPENTCTAGFYLLYCGHWLFTISWSDYLCVNGYTVQGYAEDFGIMVGGGMSQHAHATCC